MDLTHGAVEGFILDTNAAFVANSLRFSGSTAQSFAPVPPWVSALPFQDGFMLCTCYNNNILLPCVLIFRRGTSDISLVVCKRSYAPPTTHNIMTFNVYTILPYRSPNAAQLTCNWTRKIKAV